MKFVKRGEDLWLDNYEHQYMVWALPSLAIISAGLGLWLSKIERNYWAFLSSSVAVTMTILTTAFTMFPFILPSNRSLNTSLTLWDASASQASLNVLVPIVAVALLLMALISRWSFRLPNHLSKTAAPKSGCSQIS
jgi:cytochrome d ubiquinol oxidase subunit II